ncbi:hypothetical protein [Ruminococcus sp. HUN007]|uniref:hypothetical protein n=1 Tax=Ruminococcus sp. HUN007 TaxID=1514668 RepID=UPI00325AA020
MDNEIMRTENSSEEIYTSIRSFVITAQNKVYAAVNSAMVIAYWGSASRYTRLVVRMTGRSMVKIF